jgi:hypothetical protein
MREAVRRNDINTAGIVTHTPWSDLPELQSNPLTAFARPLKVRAAICRGTVHPTWCGPSKRFQEPRVSAGYSLLSHQKTSWSA